MAINNRSIFGPANPYDNGQPTASQVNGDAPMAARDDQASDLVNSSLAAEFRSAYAKHQGRGVVGGGSEGVPLGASDADYGFSTSQGDGGPGDLDGDAPAFGGGGSPGKGIAGELPLVTRGAGADSGNTAAGKAIG